MKMMEWPIAQPVFLLCHELHPMQMLAKQMKCLK